MRLLSFLTTIERALVAEQPVVEGGAWETSRMMNFHHGLARLTLKSRTNSSPTLLSGTIFLQAFALADGSRCIKATLNWKASDAFPVMTVYSTPTLNWKLEASRIASAWLAGAPTATASSTNEYLAPLAVASG